MPTIHVRNVPDALYKGIKTVADKKNRSVSAEVVSLLEAAMEEEEVKAQRKALVRRIVRRRVKLPKGTPTPEAILRQDRNR